MTIELYGFPPSPRSFKVMAVANHLGLDWTLRFLDLRKGEQKAPDYAALNPNMRAPTLVDGDFVLWESNAINQYLALRRPVFGRCCGETTCPEQGKSHALAAVARPRRMSVKVHLAIAHEQQADIIQ